MHFVVLCRDKPGSTELRAETRPSHLDYIEALNARGSVAFGGPLLDPDGSPVGSMLVLVAADRDEAIRMAGEDPYAKAGLFQKVEIMPWKWVVNAPAEA